MLKVEPASLKRGKPGSLFLPGVIILVIFASGLVLIKPKVNEIFSAQKNLKKEEERLAQLTAKTTALEGLDQAELNEKAEITAKAIPSEKDLPLLLSVLKTLAAKNNIELLSLRVDPGELATISAERKKEKLSFLNFQIIVAGQMSDFRQFLAQLTKVAPLMRADEVTIDSEGVRGSFQANFSLAAPFLPLPVSLGLPEQPLSQITREEEETYQKLARLDFYLVEEELPLVPAGKENPFVF